MRELLSASKVEKAKKPGRYCDGGGLWLQVSKWGTKSWLFVFTSPTESKVRKRDGRELGRVRHLGLGAFGRHDVTLEAARRLAGKAREQVRLGIDPIESARAERGARRLEEARRVSFRECAEKYIAAHEGGWRNGKHREQWRNTLATYAYPIIGELSVAQIDMALVLKVLEPIWASKSETAVRLRGRIERILNFANTRGYRSGANPARWRGHLDTQLPSKLRKPRHHPALPYDELPQFMAELRGRGGISARALEFTVLAAVRTSEAIGAKWSEFDLNHKLWSIPAERMKADKEHRVPLPDRAMEILAALPREHGSEFVFVGGKAGASLSNMAMLECLRQLRPGLTVHGFRSTFRDWCAERTNYPSEVAEMALAHTVADKVEAAYRRGDLFDKRRRLMAEWARYCGQKPVAKPDNVTQLRAALESLS